MRNESLIGIGIVGVLAFLFYRSKRSDIVSQNDPLDEVVTRNIELANSEIQRVSDIQSSIGSVQSNLFRLQNKLSTQLRRDVNFRGKEGLKSLISGEKERLKELEESL